MNCSNCKEENLQELSIRDFNDDNAYLENGLMNKNISRIINNEGILEWLIEFQNIIIQMIIMMKILDDISDVI